MKTIINTILATLTLIAFVYALWYACSTDTLPYAQCFIRAIGGGLVSLICVLILRRIND